LQKLRLKVSLALKTFAKIGDHLTSIWSLKKMTNLFGVKVSYCKFRSLVKYIKIPRNKNQFEVLVGRRRSSISEWIHFFSHLKGVYTNPTTHVFSALLSEVIVSVLLMSMETNVISSKTQSNADITRCGNLALSRVWKCLFNLF